MRELLEAALWRLGEALMPLVSDYRGFRIEIVAQFVDAAWNAGVRIRRTLSEMTSNR